MSLDGGTTYAAAGHGPPRSVANSCGFCIPNVISSARRLKFVAGCFFSIPCLTICRYKNIQTWWDRFPCHFSNVSNPVQLCPVPCNQEAQQMPPFTVSPTTAVLRRCALGNVDRCWQMGMWFLGQHWRVEEFSDDAICCFLVKQWSRGCEILAEEFQMWLKRDPKWGHPIKLPSVVLTLYCFHQEAIILSHQISW